MTTYSLTLIDAHLQQLKNHLLRDDECEHAAYLICNRADVSYDPWDRHGHTKYLCAEVIPVRDDQVLKSTKNLVTWKTASFVSVLKRAEANGHTVAIVHNHPAQSAVFSAQDDANEPDLAQLAVNRNGVGTELLSIILTADCQLTGRVWIRPVRGAFEPMRMIRVIGDRIDMHYRGRGVEEGLPAFHRQALAFGHAFNQDLRQLRIAVVGIGGTGSAVAMLLARLGVGQLALIDNDIVDETNLNRLHGATQPDADLMRPKVDVVARSLAEMGLGGRIVPIESWVGDPGCRDVLRTCDIIFGCTDDHEGRLLLNRFSYYYLVPVIDVGLAIDLGKHDSTQIRALDGRVSVLQPQNTCLLCRGVIDAEQARSETMRRSNPAEYELRKAEAYVLGEGNPNPAVVTFTTELACMGVTEMIHRLQGFRGELGSAANRVRKFQLGLDRRPNHPQRPSCRICGDDRLWGRGDAETFLGRID